MRTLDGLGKQQIYRVANHLVGATTEDAFGAGTAENHALFIVDHDERVG